MQGPTSHFEHVKINSVIAKGNIQYGILVLWESILSCELRFGLFSRCLLHMNGMQVAMARCGGEESWNKRFSDVKQNFGSIQEINFRSVLNNSNFAFFSKEPLPKIPSTTPGSIISESSCSQPTNNWPRWSVELGACICTTHWLPFWQLPLARLVALWWSVGPLGSRSWIDERYFFTSVNNGYSCAIVSKIYRQTESYTKSILEKCSSSDLYVYTALSTRSLFGYCVNGRHGSGKSDYNLWDILCFGRWFLDQSAVLKFSPSELKKKEELSCRCVELHICSMSMKRDWQQVNSLLLYFGLAVEQWTPSTILIVKQ